MLLALIFAALGGALWLLAGALGEDEDDRILAQLMILCSWLLMAIAVVSGFVSAVAALITAFGT
jgi:hypothetical protein